MSFDRYYQTILTYILRKGERMINRTGVTTLSCFGEQLKWDLRQGFPMLGLRKLNLKWPALELEWMIRGQSDSTWLVGNGCHIWDKWSNILHQRDPIKWQSGNLGRVYGAQWRSFGKQGGVDQLQKVVEQLLVDPLSRRIIMSLWSPNELDDMALPPCHILYQFSVRSNQFLDMMVVQRSMDFPVGGPHDIAQFAMLQTVLARLTGYIPRELTISVGDLHIYQDQIGACLQMLGREPTHTPALVFNPLTEGSAFGRLLGFNAGQVCLAGYTPHEPIKIPVTA